MSGENAGIGLFTASLLLSFDYGPGLSLAHLLSHVISAYHLIGE